MINYPKLKNALRDLMSQTKVCIDSMLIGVEDILCISVDSKDNVALLFIWCTSISMQGIKPVLLTLNTKLSINVYRAFKC